MELEFQERSALFVQLKSCCSFASTKQHHLILRCNKVSFNRPLKPQSCFCYCYLRKRLNITKEIVNNIQYLSAVKPFFSDIKEF